MSFAERAECGRRVRLIRVMRDVGHDAEVLLHRRGLYSQQVFFWAANTARADTWLVALTCRNQDELTEIILANVAGPTAVVY